MLRRAMFLGIGLIALVALVAPLGCQSGTATIDDGSQGLGGSGGFGGLGGLGGAAGASGASGAAGTGQPGGLGDPCSPTQACRPGMVCSAGGTCEFGASTGPGLPCTASGECQKGHFCGPTHACTPATGAAKENEPCESDASCADGLRCNLLGFAAVCQPGGKGDLGDACASPADCTAGLGCLQGVCGQAPVGMPPLGLPWDGISCAKEEGAPVAWFRVPRGEGDGDFYRLPYPNDIRTSNGKPDLSSHPTPGPGFLGFDAAKRYTEALGQRQGFGSYAVTYFRFNTPVDIDSLRKEGVIQFIDVTAGAPEFGQSLGLYWLMAYSRGKYICENWFGVRPAPYSLPQPGHTYAVILKKGPVTDSTDPAQQKPIEPSSDFSAVLADAAPAEAPLAAAHKAYGPLRSYLKNKKIDPASLLNAAVFTVGKLADPAEKLAAAASASAPKTSGWVKCSEGVKSPCPDADGDRACGPADPDYDELHALVDLPIYQSGKAPYLTPDDGGGIDTSGATVSPVRTEQVCLALTVPKGTMPAKGWPAVVYAHGTGGSFRSHINEGVARSLAKAESPMAVLGIDQVQHGPRRGGSTQGPDVLFYNFANPAAALGNPLQGGADQAALGALAASFSLDAATSPTGAAITLDPESIAFWGHSQGATAGGLGVPYSPHYRTVLFSGQGGSLADALVNKTKPQNIAAALPFALQDPDGTFKLYASEFNPVLSLLQAYIDPADPANHARRFATAVKEGATPKHIFQVYGQADSFSPVATQQAFAMAAGLGLVAPDPSVTKPDDIWGQPTNPPPFAGNLSSGDKSFTAALRQYTPAADYDGHFVAFRNPTAQADVARFLSMAAQGKVPAVGSK